MNYKEKLKEHIEKSRKFNDELVALGVKTNFDEKSGEIGFKLSDFKVPSKDDISTNETKRG